ncbi:MAG: phosphosulfolactate synthase [Bacteroidales bacterium]
MSFILHSVPTRPVKPRSLGLTMVIDKGLGCNELTDLLEISGEYIDFIKLGFGTALISGKLKEKLNLIKSFGVTPYFGGTLFEAFIIRKQFSDFAKYVSQNNLEMVEVSDGSIELPHDEKLEYIQALSKEFIVLSEVGSKKAEKTFDDQEWVNQMQEELKAGSWKVIAEARESGTIGIYDAKGNPNKKLITAISEKIKLDDIIWEAPNKNQQIMFIKQFGYNVNLGNIAPSEALSLETLRLGLRGDTFFDFMQE